MNNPTTKSSNSSTTTGIRTMIGGVNEAGKTLLLLTSKNNNTNNNNNSSYFMVGRRSSRSMGKNMTTTSPTSTSPTTNTTSPTTNTTTTMIMIRRSLILAGVFLMTIIFHQYVYQYIRLPKQDDYYTTTNINNNNKTSNNNNNKDSLSSKLLLSSSSTTTTTKMSTIKSLKTKSISNASTTSANFPKNPLYQQQQQQWKSPKVLIAQYGAYPSPRGNKNTTYEEMLRLTSQANQEYALQWNYDYLILRGIPFPPSSLNTSSSSYYRIDQYIIDGKRVPVDESYYDTIDTSTLGRRESLTTYSKVTILEIVMNDPLYRQYDVLVLLDADAMIYDYSRDIAQLIPRNKMLVAHRVWQYVTTSITTNINIGITIWNLRHSMTSTVVQLWKKACIERIEHHPTWRDDDQTPLQHILYNYFTRRQRRQLLLALRNEFYYHQGTFVKHFKRQNSHSWSDTNGQNSRITPIVQAIYEICISYNEQLSTSSMCENLQIVDH